MGIGMVFLAVGFIMFPIATTACSTLLAWSYATVNATMTSISIFTGLSSIVGITPLLILIGFVSAAVLTGFMGVKVMKGTGSANLGPGGLLMLGLSIVFISIGLIIEPVILDACASVIHGGGLGISATFVGLASIVAMVPMLVHIAFLAAAVITGFFGIKKLS
jgi:hypothetical protein